MFNVENFGKYCINNAHSQSILFLLFPTNLSKSALSYYTKQSSH